MKDDTIGTICAAAIVAVIAAFITESIVTQHHRREAVARGHAEFVADKEGNVEFKWKEAK